MYLCLKELVGSAEGVTLTSINIAKRVQRKFDQELGGEGVAVAIKVLVELGLVATKGDDRQRSFFLKPVPPEKLDIEKSTVFKKGMDAKHSFAVWSSELIKTTVNNIWKDAAGKLEFGGTINGFKRKD